MSLTTARGSTLLPLLTYSGDGGNFNTYRQVGTLSGTYRHFDYYSAFARTVSASCLTTHFTTRPMRKLWLDA